MAITFGSCGYWNTEVAITFGEPVGTTIAGWFLLMEIQKKTLKIWRCPHGLETSLYIYIYTPYYVGVHVFLEMFFKIRLDRIRLD